jgi:predicted dinucleotide-binding enzyme
MKIGIIGAGMIGSTLARLWTEHEVLLSSRHPERLDGLVEELGSRARRGTPLEAARWAEVLLLAIPFAATAHLGAEVVAALQGKIVIDAGNPFEGRDGSAAAEVAASGRGSGRWTADKLPGARIVKAFNTVYFQRMLDREGVGVPLASDDPDALAVVEGLVAEAGMDPVVIGSLDRAVASDPGTPVWNSGMSAPELRAALIDPTSR